MRVIYLKWHSAVMNDDGNFHVKFCPCATDSIASQANWQVLHYFRDRRNPRCLYFVSRSYPTTAPPEPIAVGTVARALGVSNESMVPLLSRTKPCVTKLLPSYHPVVVPAELIAWARV